MQFSFIAEPDFETLVDDETGRIVYKRALFEAAQARAWFGELRDHVTWHTERRPMYDRVVEVPRLLAAFALDDLDVPQPLRTMRTAVESFCGVRFTSAGLNFYRDQHDSVAPHGDHVEKGPDNAPVALVSLGATRRMTIRSTTRPRRILDRDLEAGSLLVMSYESHLNFEHGIPKERHAVGPRISVAFRRIPKEALGSQRRAARSAAPTSNQ